MLVYGIRTVVMYTVLVVVIRLLGKRQVGQLAPSEFVVTMLVANLASVTLENIDVTLTAGLIPIGTVLLLEMLLSRLSLKSIRFRKLLCGKPVILIENGNILQENLRKTRVTLDELTGHLREKDVLDIRSVQYAILETSGNLSVFPYPKEKPASAKDAGIKAQKQSLPLTVISDGVLIEDNLQKAGKDLRWLKTVLQEQKATVRETWLLTVDGAGHVVFYKKDI